MTQIDNCQQSLRNTTILQQSLGEGCGAQYRDQIFQEFIGGGFDNVLCCLLPVSRPRQELYTSLGTTWSLNDYAIEKVTIDSKRPQVQQRISVPWTCSTAKARRTVGAQSTRTGNPNGRGDTVRRQIPQRHLRRYRKRVVTKRGGRLGGSESPTPD
jgi:hypothetical protein